IGHKVLEVQQGGYTQTVGVAGYTVTADATGLDFANFNKIDLSGTKYEDANGDGDITGDLGLGGFTIFIDLNDNGTNDEDPAYVTTTAANGTWSFTGLGPEVIGHNVLEVQQGGFTQTLGQAGYLVSGDATDLNFANFELYDIAGTKYRDFNGNGVVDGFDNGLEGWTIFIDADGDGKIAGDTNDNGLLDGVEVWTEKYAFTDSNGDWSITGLDASYDGMLVKEFIQQGWTQTLGPAAGIVGTSGNDQDDFDFANFRLFTISGHKYLDLPAMGSRPMTLHLPASPSSLTPMATARS